jgi:hypothetical protein
MTPHKWVQTRFNATTVKLECNRCGSMVVTLDGVHDESTAFLISVDHGLDYDCDLQMAQNVIDG